MTTLTSHFDGEVLVPDEPVDLPIHVALKVTVEPREPDAGLKANRLRWQQVGGFPDGCKASAVEALLQERHEERS